MNRRIAAHAQAKDLAATRSVLETLEAKGWANGHTYAAAVHALCRCGDWRSAEEALKRAEKAGHFKRGAGCASGLITRAFAFTLNSGCFFSFWPCSQYVQVMSTYFSYNFLSLSSFYNNCDTFEGRIVASSKEHPCFEATWNVRGTLAKPRICCNAWRRRRSWPRGPTYERPIPFCVAV